MMLHSRRNYVSAFGHQKPGRSTDCQINTLSCAACENNLASLAFPYIGNPLARVIQKSTNLPANTVNAGGITIIITQKRQHRLLNGGIKGGRRVVIEINRFHLPFPTEKKHQPQQQCEKQRKTIGNEKGTRGEQDRIKPKAKKCTKLFTSQQRPGFLELGQAEKMENQADILAATASRGTSARILSNTRSVETPSASASKFRIKR